RLPSTVHRLSSIIRLKRSILRGSWVGDHVTDVVHAGDELYQALEAQAKSAVNAGSETTGVQIPPQFLFIDMQGLHFFFQHFQTLFTLRSADDLTDARK